MVFQVVVEVRATFGARSGRQRFVGRLVIRTTVREICLQGADLVGVGARDTMVAVGVSMTIADVGMTVAGAITMVVNKEGGMTSGHNSLSELLANLRPNAGIRQ